MPISINGNGTITGINNSASKIGIPQTITSNSTDTSWSVSTASTWTDTPLTATITPYSITNKILIMVSSGWWLQNNAATQQIVQLRISQTISGATTYSDTMLISGPDSRSRGTSFGQLAISGPINYLFSPATTNSIVYKLQITQSGNTSVQHSSSNMTIMEIAV